MNMTILHADTSAESSQNSNESSDFQTQSSIISLGQKKVQGSSNDSSHHNSDNSNLQYVIQCASKEANQDEKSSENKSLEKFKINKPFNSFQSSVAHQEISKNQSAQSILQNIADDSTYSIHKYNAQQQKEDYSRLCQSEPFSYQSLLSENKQLKMEKIEMSEEIKLLKEKIQQLAKADNFASDENPPKDLGKKYYKKYKEYKDKCEKLNARIERLRPLANDT